ncbi:hypothetical protein ANO11243_085440 [Dothideomycetidae sp. 11243]|nr:hypothetical protein ANO11243_085440 [fungal sp. No.11243]
MRISSSLLLAAATFAGFCAAQSSSLNFTNVPTSVTAGQAVTIEYTTGSPNEPVTITLRKGDTADSQTIQTLTSSATNGTFLWIPANDYEDGSDYTLQIVQGDAISQSGPFTISGSDPAAVSSAMAATASLASLGAALTASYASSMSVASIESIIASYNSSLASLTAPPNASSSIGAGGSSAGTGSSILRNTTFSSATIVNTSEASNSASAGSGSSPSSSASNTATTTATGPASASSSKGAAVKVVSAISGASPLALVLCVFAADIPNSGSYTLTIPADTVRGSDYTIEIRSASGGSNYTPYFVIESTITVASTTASSASASSTASGSMTSGSMTSSASASGKSSSSASGSKTTSGSSTSTSGAAFQSASSSASSGNSAPRATAAAGMMGLVALGALAL